MHFHRLSRLDHVVTCLTHAHLRAEGLDVSRLTKTHKDADDVEYKDGCFLLLLFLTFWLVSSSRFSFFLSTDTESRASAAAAAIAISFSRSNCHGLLVVVGLVAVGVDGAVNRTFFFLLLTFSSSSSDSLSLSLLSMAVTALAVDVVAVLAAVFVLDAVFVGLLGVVVVIFLGDAFSV
jgi:hypothetical protein